MLSHDTFNHRKRALSCSTPSKNGQPCYTLHRLFKQSVYDPCLPGGTFYKHAWTLAVKRSHPLSGPKIFGPPGKSSPFAKWGVSLYYKQFKIVDRICSFAPGSVVIDKLKSWRYSKCAGSLFRFQGDVANHFLPPILDVNHCVKEWFLCMSRIQNFQAGKFEILSIENPKTSWNDNLLQGLKKSLKKRVVRKVSKLRVARVRLSKLSHKFLSRRFSGLVCLCQRFLQTKRRSSPRTQIENEQCPKSPQRTWD